MTSVVAAAALVLGAVLLGVQDLTAVGERRRDRGLGPSVTTGIFFPVTWAVRYLRDERASRKAPPA